MARWLVALLLRFPPALPTHSPCQLCPTPYCCSPSPQVVGLVSGLGMSWQATFGAILALYFYSHCFFASGESSG